MFTSNGKNATTTNLCCILCIRLYGRLCGINVHFIHWLSPISALCGFIILRKYTQLSPTLPSLVLLPV